MGVYLLLFFSQRNPVLLLPDGEAESPREAGLCAQYPGLHYHGHPCAAGGGDQQSGSHGQEASRSR